MPIDLDAVHGALATVNDPEIHQPITELGMVKSVDADASGHVTVEVYLTVAGCPMRDRITNDVTAAVSAVAGVTDVTVSLDVMSEEQRDPVRATQLPDPCLRRRVRQRRRRQVVRHGEPRRRDGC